MGKHLTIKDRVIIQYQIEHYNNISCLSIAKDLKCNESSVYRELKRNLNHKVSRREVFAHMKTYPCPKLKTFPFVCNACTHKARCSKEIVVYDAYDADHKAIQNLHNSRRHPQLNESEMSELNQQVSERVINHQSLFHILQSDKRIKVSESTLRRYIDRQYLDCRNIDLPQTVRFPYTKTSSNTRRKRINIEFLVNRTYQDYQDYSHSTQRTVLQLDTVIGSIKDTKCLLTLYEPRTKFQWGYIIHKTATSVNHVLSGLVQTLQTNHQLFFDCLLTDNGAEFQSLPQLETTDEGEILLRVFYCDPYSSFQKGGCERNHSLIRYVIRKGESLDFVSQDEVNGLFSHINSQKRKSLSGKTPFQAFFERFHFYPSDFIPIFEVQASKIKLKK